MSPDVGDRDSDVDVDEDDLDLADIARILHGDPDEDAIETESPRAADDDRFGWLEGNLGDVVIYDERNPLAWVSTQDAEDLEDRE